MCSYIDWSIVNTDRKSVHGFTFSDGTYIPAENTVCVPQQAVMLDPLKYKNPNIFDGDRFLEKSEAKLTSRFSHPSPVFPFWETPGRAW